MKKTFAHWFQKGIYCKFFIITVCLSEETGNYIAYNRDRTAVGRTEEEAVKLLKELINASAVP